MQVSRALVSIAAVIVIIAGIAAAKSILVPFFFAVFIAVIAAGVYLRIQGLGVPSWLAIGVIALGSIGFFFALIILVFTSIDQFREVLPEYSERFQGYRDGVVNQLVDWGIEVPAGSTEEVFNFDSAMQIFLSMLSSFGNILGYMVLVLAMVIFIFMEVAVFPRKVKAAFGETGNVLGFIGEVNHAIEQYFFIKTISNALSGLIVAGWMALFGVEFALFWGMMTFLLNYIPYFGAILAAVPAIVLGLLSGGPVVAGAMAFIFIAMSFFFGNFFEPRLLGQSVNLSILFIFLAMLFWGLDFGAGGDDICRAAHRCLEDNLGNERPHPLDGDIIGGWPSQELKSSKINS